MKKYKIQNRSPKNSHVCVPLRWQHSYISDTCYLEWIEYEEVNARLLFGSTKTLQSHG